MSFGLLTLALLEMAGHLACPSLPATGVHRILSRTGSPPATCKDRDLEDHSEALAGMLDDDSEETGPSTRRSDSSRALVPPLEDSRSLLHARLEMAHDLGAGLPALIYLFCALLI